jgi:hypothetical protein
MNWMPVSIAGCLLFASCLPNPDWSCADCCPPGNHTVPLILACRLSRPDGGPASGVSVLCSAADAGAVSDSTGAVSLKTEAVTCGIAAGSDLCGSLQFLENGVPLTATSDAGAVSGVFGASGCQVTVR